MVFRFQLRRSLQIRQNLWPSLTVLNTWHKPENTGQHEDSAAVAGPVSACPCMRSATSTSLGINTPQVTLTPSMDRPMAVHGSSDAGRTSARQNFHPISPTAAAQASSPQGLRRRWLHADYARSTQSNIAQHSNHPEMLRPVGLHFMPPNSTKTVTGYTCCRVMPCGSLRAHGHAAQINLPLLLHIEQLMLRLKWRRPERDLAPRGKNYVVQKRCGSAQMVSFAKRCERRYRLV